MQFQPMLNILLLALLWGPSFLFIKYCMADMGPITIVTLRLGIAAVLLFLFLKFKRISLPNDFKLWKQCFIMGIFASAAPFMLFGYALQHVDTILTALINGTTPILTVILANYFLKDEPLTLNRLLGVVLGLSGFLVLFLPSLISKGISGDTLGILMSFGAACCYAIGMVYARKNIIFPSQKLVIPTMQLLTTLLYMIPLSYFIDPTFSYTEISTLSWISMLGLSIVGTVFAFIVYYRIIMWYGATALSTVTYILPILNMIIGVLFLEESITLNFILAASLILFGVMVINNLIPIRFYKKKLAPV